jgi:hypothetical protein
MPDALTELNVFAGYDASGSIEWCAVITFSMVYEGMPSAVSEGYVSVLPYIIAIVFISGLL